MVRGSGGWGPPHPARNSLAMLGALTSGILICGLLATSRGSLHLWAGESPRGTSMLSIAGISIGNLPEVTVGEEAPGFPVGDDVQWLNTVGSKPPKALRGMPLDLKHLQHHGHQVLLHFWDYTDMDSLRSVPVVRQIHKHYGSYGLQVISVHRSEYPFAKMLSNVAEAVERLEISHAVVNDKEGDIFSTYGSKDTLNFFLIDEHNIVRAVHGGKGSEDSILAEVCAALKSKYGRIQCQETLSESHFKTLAGHKGQDALYIHPRHYPAFPPKYQCKAATSEILVGHEDGRGSLTARQAYSVSGAIQYTDLSGVEILDGTFVLSGDWETTEDGMTAAANPSSGMANTHLRLRYHGKEASVLMGVQGREEAVAMCADGVHGPAEEHSACLSECENEAGPDGLWGWCRTEGGKFGGCTPCEHVEAVKVYVQMNGEPLALQVRGKDVVEDALGRTYVAVLEPRVYFVVEEVHAWPRGLELIPAAAGVTVHSATFAGECSADWDHES